MVAPDAPEAAEAVPLNALHVFGFFFFFFQLLLHLPRLFQFHFERLDLLPESPVLVLCALLDGLDLLISEGQQLEFALAQFLDQPLVLVQVDVQGQLGLLQLGDEVLAVVEDLGQTVPAGRLLAGFAGSAG